MNTPYMPKLTNGATYCTGPDGARICTGSQMGRRNTLPIDRRTPCALRLVRLPFVSGDYDQGGAYWGGPSTVYRAYGDNPKPQEPSEETVELFVRGSDRDSAKRAVKEILPLARFFR